ncbi:fimbrillin family protein [Massilibacteroides vaginae]|uniref:fimbrillin family protein n=1 Tax=Massilibacteroides vaginae TaxID=1673718 RepID=UPI000A1C7F77|nr:fimbrillin family protein [Massilibacteroides vaginae]
MKKFLFAAMAATVCLTSCSNDNDEVVKVESDTQLKVNPSIGLMTRAAKSAWSANDQLGVFVTTGTINSAYEGIASNLNVPFTYNGSTWTSARIPLTNNAATIFAYYPYVSSVTDGTAMAVESTSQTDYLYGTGKSTATVLSQNVDIEMKHALSQVLFKMKLGNYTGGAGNLTKVVISNENGGTALNSTGTLNIPAGTVATATPQNLDLTASQTIQATESSFSAIVMPVSALASATILKVTFTIDGEEFHHFFKAGTVWEQGYRNIYSFNLNDNGLEIGGGDNGNGGGVTIEPWTDDDEGTITLVPKV